MQIMEENVSQIISSFVNERSEIVPTDWTGSTFQCEPVSDDVDPDK